MKQESFVHLSETEIGKKLKEKFEKYNSQESEMNDREKEMLLHIWFLWGHLCQANFSMQHNSFLYVMSLVNNLTKNYELTFKK